MTYSIELEKTSLVKLINKLTEATKRDVFIKSLNEGALVLSGWTKKNRLSGPRPRFLGVKTGRLRSSISAGQTRKTSEGYENTIGTNVVYAPTHEFGYPKRNIPARPFLRPTIEYRQNQRDVLNILTRRINEALSQ